MDSTFHPLGEAVDHSSPRELLSLIFISIKQKGFCKVSVDKTQYTFIAYQCMGKYEDAKFLLRRKARKEWTCFRCGKKIAVGEYYYRESLGLIDKGPHIVLQAYCENCGLPDKDGKDEWRNQGQGEGVQEA